MPRPLHCGLRYAVRVVGRNRMQLLLRSRTWLDLLDLGLGRLPVREAASQILEDLPHCLALSTGSGGGSGTLAGPAPTLSIASRKPIALSPGWLRSGPVGRPPARIGLHQRNRIITGLKGKILAN